MKHLSWIVTFPVTVVVVVFAVANREEVTVQFWPLPSLPLPLWLLVLGSLLLGFLLGGFVAGVASAPRRRRARQTAERARELARQLAELQRRQTLPAAAGTSPAGQAVTTGAGISQRSGAALERLPGA